MFDEKEKLRSFFNTQYVKMKRMSAVGSLILMAINLSLTLYPYLAWREFNIYFAVPLIFIGIILLIWAMSHVYVRVFEMYRTESKADVLYNPYAVYAMAPKDEMFIRDVYLPIMESSYKLMPDCIEKNNLGVEVSKVKVWCEKGFIPKEHFPEHLKQYYITDKQIRL